MQKVRGCANFAIQLLDDTLNLFSLFRKFRSNAFRMTNKLSDIHAEHSQGLTSTVMQFPRYMAAFLVLATQQVVRKLSNLFGLLQQVGIFVFQFIRPSTYLEFKSLRQISESLLALS